MISQKSKPVLLITGASGFIGRELTKTLAPDYHLLGLSRLDRPPEPLIEWFQADVSDVAQLRQAFEEMTGAGRRIDGVIHLAAHIDLLDRPSDKWERVNVRGTENLLQETIRHRIPFFVYASSVVVMEPPRSIAFLDETARREARLRYAVSKLRAEEVVERYSDTVNAVILRIASVYSRDPHLSYLNYQIASLFNGDLSTRFLPTPLTGGMPYVSLVDTCRAFSAVLKRRQDIRSGEIYVISEEGYLPHSAAFRKIAEGFEGVRPAIFPIPMSVAKWGTFLRHLWERLFHPHLHLRPWMAEFATLPFCVDTRKARRELQWMPHFHIVSYLESVARDIRADPEHWFKQRNLRLKKTWVRYPKKKLLYLWDHFFCPFVLDTIKILRAYTPLRVKTLVWQREDKERYEKLTQGEQMLEEEILFNLHKIELPCHIPWRILLKVIVMSWPTSLVHFVQTRRGYDYRFLGHWDVLHFGKVREAPGSFLTYKVTSGFAAGGYQTFLVNKDSHNGKHYLYIDTRVPRRQLFPVRIHNFYTAEHLRNIHQNLFSFRLKKGENLL